MCIAHRNTNKPITGRYRTLDIKRLANCVLKALKTLKVLKNSVVQKPDFISITVAGAALVFHQSSRLILTAIKEKLSTSRHLSVMRCTLMSLAVGVNFYS